MSYYRCIRCNKRYDTREEIREHMEREHADELIRGHAYLSPGDTPYAKGDVCYHGCFICGESRWLHTR